MRRWTTFALAVVLVLFTAIVTGVGNAGCAAVAGALPSIVAAVLDGTQILDLIEQAVARYFAAHPDPAAQQKVAEVAERCRVALNAALHAARGAKDLDDEAIDRAFEEFKQAYLELAALTRPYGVRMGAGHALRAAPGELEVPEPGAIVPPRRKR